GSGVSVRRFRLGVNRRLKKKKGEREGDFMNVVVFREEGEKVNKYV
ncbi:single-stranded DNA-binding protein, partial [Staphylococcus epidermidis]